MDLKDQYIGMNMKERVKIEILQTSIKYFLESNFLLINRLFVLTCPNEDANA